MSRPRSEAGYAALLVSVLLPVVCMGLAAIAVDVARWYVEIERVQKAADAGALAGVTYVPADLGAATAAAREIAKRNGYDHAASTVDVAVTEGSRPSELRVTVSSTIDNAFGALIGLDETTITRTALTDYTGPAPMGSPCNTFGNEPDAGTLGPPGSQLVVPPGASCPRYPEFWSTAAGPRVYKTQGDQYGVRYCQGGESGCTGQTNDEYRPEGYFMLVRIQPEAVGVPVTLQIYDPSYVDTDSRCTNGPSGTFPGSLVIWNPYSLDGNTRYERAPGLFCTGDNNNSGLRVGGETGTTTSYGLRAPVETFDPLDAPPVPTCAAQFPGYTSLSVGNLRVTNGSYNNVLARVFHQWVDLCTFIPTDPGDYYLQVRTNVALGGTVDATGAYRGSNANRVYSQVGDDPNELGNGSNRYAVRAVGTAAGKISVSAWSRMPIFANSDAATPVFNLIRVLPGAAGKSLVFKFFDVGDAAANGTLTVLRPTEATGSPLANCQGDGFQKGPLPTCQVTGIKNSAGWNGQSQTIIVPIPHDYDCAYDHSGGCWFRVQVDFGTGNVTDQTTWTASVEGDPVRLIE